MDTRNKILTVEAALAIETRPIGLAAGSFDLLRAELVAEMESARAKTLSAALRPPPSRCAVPRAPNGALLAAVLPSRFGWLDARARAELAAGLRVIDYVVIAEHADLDRLIQALRPATVVDLEATEARLASQLIEHVRTAH